MAFSRWSSLIVLLLYEVARTAGEEEETASASGLSCSDLLSGGGGDFNVPEVSNGSYLRSLLQDAGSSSSPPLLSLQSINGTRWLNLGGSVDGFGLVLGAPPSTSSDLGLEEALELLENAWSPRGVLVDFSPAGLHSSADGAIERYSKTLPVFATVPLDDVDSPLGKGDRLNLRWGKAFGLDSVFERVAREGMLLPLDLQRIRGIVEDWYRGSVSESDLRFLRLRYERMKKRGFKQQQQGSRGAFTDLFMASALQLMEAERGGGSGQVHLLPDLQARDSAYTQSEAAFLKRILFDGDSPPPCTLVTVRAAVLVNSPESVDAVRSVFDGSGDGSRVSVALESKPYDDLTKEDLRGLRARLGEERTVVLQDLRMEWPEERKEMEEEERRVPRPDFDELDEGDSSGVAKRMTSFWCYYLAGAALVARRRLM